MALKEKMEKAGDFVVRVPECTVEKAQGRCWGTGGLDQNGDV